MTLQGVISGIKWNWKFLVLIKTSLNSFPSNLNVCNHKSHRGYDPKFTVKEFMLHPKSLCVPDFFAAAINEIIMLEGATE